MTTRGAVLRVSLLMAMGIVPAAACSSSEGTGGKPDNAAGQGGEGGSGGSATKPSAGEAGADVKGDGGAPYQVGTCTNPQVDPDSGLVKCDEGFSHRATAKRCEAPATGSGGEGGIGGAMSSAGGGGDVPDPEQLPRVSGLVDCLHDASACSQFQYGFCDRQYYPSNTRFCGSGCVTDDDCGTGAVCICGDDYSPTGGRCAPADCKTDDDCGAGLCASYDLMCGLGLIGLTCQSAQDACVTSEDCQEGTCTYDQGGGDLRASTHRYCNLAACGRPFLVHEQARVAPVTRSAAWRAAQPLKPRVDHLTEEERASLAAHWTKLGQLEHASIAAFARFSLQLLALGAPPDLVESCTQALADETAHTKLCFELASAYAGRAIGPGPLDIDGSLAASSLADIVDLVLAEGCFGETSAALEAFEAAETAVDPLIASAYAQIATDEQRHAELAFRFMRWALERGGDAVAERIAAVVTTPPSSTAATRDVTLPCLRALLEAFGAPSPSSSAQRPILAC